MLRLILAIGLFVGLITPGLAADPVDGKYYAEDENEGGVIWKLYLKVAGNEISARVSYENAAQVIGELSKDELPCGSTELDTNGEFELWCGGSKLSGDLKEASIWPIAVDQHDTGSGDFKLIRNSELANFNRFKAETGSHKTAAYIDSKSKPSPSASKFEAMYKALERELKLAEARRKAEARKQREAEAASSPAEVEKRRLAKLAAAEKKRQAEIARKKAEAKKQHEAEAARLAAKAEKRRLAKLAEAEKKRPTELARRRAEEKERKRQAEIARRKAEEKRIAAAKRKAERDKALYTALASSAEVLSTNARQFIRHSPDDIRLRGKCTTIRPPRELHPLCSHPMA